MPKISRIKKEEGGKKSAAADSRSWFLEGNKERKAITPPPHFGRKFLGAQIFLIFEQVEKGGGKGGI